MSSNLHSVRQHSKSDIAAELAWRDQRIEELEKDVALREQAAITNKRLHTEALAREVRLREALEWLRRNGTNDELAYRVAQDAVMQPTDDSALRQHVSAELRDIASGFMANDPTDDTRFMQYYGSHVRGVLLHRASELEE